MVPQAQRRQRARPGQARQIALELLTVHVLSTALLGALFGGMAFFALFFSPLLHLKLRAETAAQLMRQMLPPYQVSFAVLCAGSAWLLTQHRLPQDAFLMAAVAVSFVFAAMGLEPRLQTLNQRLAQGQAVAAQLRWIKGMRAVLVAMQILISGALFVRAIGS